MTNQTSPLQYPPPATPLPTGAAARPTLQALAASGERLRNAWEVSDGMVFVEHERPEGGCWENGAAEAPALHHFYIQSIAHVQCGEFNGVPQRAVCPEGAVQILLPGDRVHAAGEGATRTLHVAMTTAHLNLRIAEHRAPDQAVRPSRAYRGDYALAVLAKAHQAATEFGLSGHQPYFDALRLAIEDRLVAVFLRCMLGCSPAREFMAPSRARRVVEYVDDNLCGALRLDDLGAVAGMSKFHFSRAFRNTLGTTPHAFVLGRRLARALDLLRHGQPVGKVAKACGFADHAHLTRQFRRGFGFPPSALS